MKSTLQKLWKGIVLCSFLFALQAASAQAPNKMSYQAVIRNASNALVANANVGIRISVLQGTVSGTAVYVESQTATTNGNGLVTLEIGAGTIVTGTFASISWGTNTYFIKTETDPTGGTNYTIVGTSQFLSVPYALFASNSGSVANNWSTVGNDIYNNNNGYVGIGTGTTVPSSLLTVKEDGIGFTQEDFSGVSKIGFYTTSGSAYLQTHSNSDLLFATNNGIVQMTLQKATGNLGIGATIPTEKLEVAGKTKTTNLQVTTGAGAGKVLTSDASGNATWQTPTSTAGTVNQEYETTAYDLSTTIQGSDVDFPTTNVSAPTAGTYLITYYVDAYNTFTNVCFNGCGDPLVYFTNAMLFNKTTSGKYQTQRVDFSLQDLSAVAATQVTNTTLPAHQISGSVVRYLDANDQIGFKMRSFSDAGTSGEIRIRESVITLIKLH